MNNFLPRKVKYKHSNVHELADRLLDEPIPLHSRVARERRAANVLNVWDRQADADSRGAVLFAFWACNRF